MKGSPKTNSGRSSLSAKSLQPDRSQAPAHSSQFAMHLSLFSVATFAAFLHSPTIILAHTNHSTATSSAPASTPSASLLVYTALISAVKDKAKVEHVRSSLPTTSSLPYLDNQLIFSSGSSPPSHLRPKRQSQRTRRASLRSRRRSQSKSILDL